MGNAVAGMRSQSFHYACISFLISISSFGLIKWTSCLQISSSGLLISSDRRRAGQSLLTIEDQRDKPTNCFQTKFYIDLSVIESIDNKWFFFFPKDRKYQNGKRSNHATVSNYRKATRKDRTIKANRGSSVIGRKKMLVFYTGKAPKGEITHWVIHEYCATEVRKGT
ncbi:hypothetical protein L2E82_22165 [Cichorium intybus]|uniref:Uncharacterized protein n=1 Tax=Cichorium intybus TaxID=13427 RepID=A0ACB9DWL0_CICIN|nr:hypothetical protein L2E82_22165 [Cichorium intybus]